MGKTAKQFLKISLALLIGGLVITASFVSGMVVYANFFVPANGNGSVTTALPFFPSAPNTNRSLQFEHGEMPSEFATFWEAWAFLNEQFYGEIPADDERVYGAIRGMVTAFGDQHTACIDPVQAAISGENKQGSFSGVGATVRMDEAGREIVVDPTPNPPAF
jgi:C-terminal processing protease CtpA/Prc